MSLCNLTIQMFLSNGCTIADKCPTENCGQSVGRHRDENAPQGNSSEFFVLIPVEF